MESGEEDADAGEEDGIPEALQKQLEQGQQQSEREANSQEDQYRPGGSSGEERSAIQLAEQDADHMQLRSMVGSAAAVSSSMLEEAEEVLVSTARAAASASR